MSPTHFLVVCTPLFGHVRPIFSFTMNLLVMYPELYITYVTTGTSSPSFSPPSIERETILYGLADEPRSRLNVKLLGEGNLNSLLEQMGSLMTSFPSFLEDLLKPAVQPSPFKLMPALAVLDVLLFSAIDMLDAIIPHKIPALAYIPTNAALVNLYWVRKDEYPETYWGPVYREAEKQAANGVHSIDYYAYKIWCKASDVVARTTSLPPMYHHELNPQTDSLDTGENSVAVAQAQLCIQLTDRMSRLDGLIIHTSPIMEPGEVEEMKRISPKHLFYPVGPQYPETWWNGGIPPQIQALSTEDKQVMSFLNEMHKRYGPNSVLYISFGTTFLPFNTPHLFDALVKTILAADPPLPFLFAGGTTNKLLTAEHREEIKKSGRALLAGFVPQQAVLKHEAIGWYLRLTIGMQCHAGSNSISEAFLNEVPMVLWPYSIDQPLIANQLSVGLGLAYELIQVRNGESIGRATYRGPVVQGTREAVEKEMSDVWKLMRGEDGAQIRQRVIAFSKAMKEDHRNGISRKAMEKFSDFMTK
ncbi:hypothetical protein BT96DRAFT_872820 [Gymnopus androsaceus JB14]|uniref:UDP-Glycosyltransferase/glycogen phosphorylase n=1 Tax=Gymnopus androsaceus JB14 TaxID=1447944 RepID=A0A6A4IFH7_9AGAR|nr:hypothetical protein BT96DRAFT_872820 [Gymnopus androsaceus JB14]